MKRIVLGKKKPIPNEIISKVIRDKMRRNLLDRIIRLYLELIEETLTKLILATPVDTGKARLNWYVSTLSDEPMGGYLPNRDGETNRRSKSHDQDGKPREDYPLQYGVQSSMTITHIQQQMSKIASALRDQIYSKGTTSIVFRNDLLYISYLEGAPYGEKHPHQTGGSWASSFNARQNQFMKTISESLKKSRLPALKRDIKKLQQSAK